MNNAQLTLTEQPAVMGTTAKVQKYAYLLDVIEDHLVDFEHRRLDVPDIANCTDIPTCEVYSALRILRAFGFLVKHDKRENRFMLYKIAPSFFGNVTPEWLAYQVQAAQIAANAKNNPKPTPKPEPTAPQPTNYGLLWGDGSTDWFESIEAAKDKGYAELGAMPDLKSVTIIQKVARLNASITVLAEQL